MKGNLDNKRLFYVWGEQEKGTLEKMSILPFSPTNKGIHRLIYEFPNYILGSVVQRRLKHPNGTPWAHISSIVDEIL